MTDMQLARQRLQDKVAEIRYKNSVCCCSWKSADACKACKQADDAIYYGTGAYIK